MSRPEKVRTRLDPQLRREQIVEAAARVLAGRDPSEVTFEEIADAAGVSRALVYNYFGDRGGLLAAVYLRGFERLDAELAEALRADAPAERLHAVVWAYLRFATTSPALWRLVHLAGALQHPAVRGARRRRMERVAQEIGGSPAARVVGVGLVGLLEAATAEWLERGDIDIGRLAEVLFDLIWTGLSSLESHGIALSTQ